AKPMKGQKKNENNGVAVANAPFETSAPDEIDEAALSVDEIDGVDDVDDGPAADSDEAILTMVQTFESVFSADPLRDRYHALGVKGCDTFDPRANAPLYVSFAIDCHDLMVAERNLAPSNYKRDEIVKKAQTALRLCGVMSKYNDPNQTLRLYWVAKLDLSPPGAEGEPRTMHHGPIPADWFSGNITVDALEMLAGFISRVSPQDNLDVWEYRDGFESKVRDMVARLRRGDLTTAMAKALLDAHGKRLK